MTTALPDPCGVIARLLGRHCAGIAQRPAPQAMLAYLRDPPAAISSPEPIDFAARSLLNCSSVPDLLEILVDCDIAPARLAAHAKHLDVTNRPVLACLRQLTRPGPAASEPPPRL